MIKVCKYHSDLQVINKFDSGKFWGIETMVNLKSCNRETIASPKHIKEFVLKLCDVIDMKPFGEPIIERFGEGHLYGYSLMQLIHTSSIIGHFAEESGDVYIDIFSCKEFAPEVAARYCAFFFEAEQVEWITVLRSTTGDMGNA